MIILVLNCGSSSIKYQVIDMQTATENTLLAKGIVERIGMQDAIVTHKPQLDGKPRFETRMPIVDHTVGINKVLELLVDPTHGVLTDLSQLDAVGNRVAHGGEFFADSALVDDNVIAKIEQCVELAPLHNPANLKGIDAVRKLLPAVPQVAAFDTSFHHTIPAKNYLYAIPYKYYEQDRVRKYGFHGTSHKFVARRGCELAGLVFEKSKVITCHIGNGASVTAIVNGHSLDTSMGFTPVDGLVMGTRCGEIDPSALLYIGEKERRDFAGLNNLINKESGVMGLTEISFDMRDIEKAVTEGNERAIVAFEMYNERVRKYIGGYAAKMGGVDLIVFTGGVGENGPNSREMACRGLEFMGVSFDLAANDGVKNQDKILSASDSRVKVAVICTNEELVIAQDTLRIVRS